MSDQMQPFTPSTPPAEPTPARPKRGSRKAKAVAAEPKRKRRKRVVNSDPLAAAFSRDLNTATANTRADTVLFWWDILVQLDEAGRKQVLQRILASP